MSHFLVTGGCGFIGSHLAGMLIGAGHEVTVFDNLSTGRRDRLEPKARLIEGDITDLRAVEAAMAGTQGCFHLAAIASVQRSAESWPETHRVNQTGSVNVMEAARRHSPDLPLPVVFASSAAVYGNCTDVPLAETAPALPISPYGADKLGSEMQGQAAAATFRSRVVALRMFNVFGPRQDPLSPYSGVISIFMERALFGRDLMVFGDGAQTRDFVFVKDAARCFLSAMDHALRQTTGFFRAYNVCSGRAITVNRLAEEILAICRATGRIDHGPERIGDIRDSLGSPERAATELGFTCSGDLAEGLRETLTWIRGGAA